MILMSLLIRTTTIDVLGCSMICMLPTHTPAFVGVIVGVLVGVPTGVEVSVGLGPCVEVAVGISVESGCVGRSVLSAGLNVQPRYTCLIIVRRAVDANLIEPSPPTGINPVMNRK